MPMVVVRRVHEDHSLLAPDRGRERVDEGGAQGFIRTIPFPRPRPQDPAQSARDHSPEGLEVRLEADHPEPGRRPNQLSPVVPEFLIDGALPKHGHIAQGPHGQSNGVSDHEDALDPGMIRPGKKGGDGPAADSTQYHSRDPRGLHQVIYGCMSVRYPNATLDLVIHLEDGLSFEFGAKASL